ncbi:uncharacterized protein [Diadema antillarum]|uniref:uncharacterized protein n=1 Tax=Diadema antillarum TaxID=105358 RepID=UPI003A8BBCDF
MWNGTCTTRELKVYEHLDEGDADNRRKMVMDTVSCHMMGLRSSWDGLEDDMKKHKIVQLLTDLGKRGMMDLVGVRDTIGTQLVFPPTRDILEESFREQNKSGSALTVGARALAKHCHRDESSNWWGNLSGSEKAKNESAEKVLRKILNDVGWLNIHQLPHALPILEVRNIEGYGARWSPDGREFRGFLEPPMVAGWETGYRH